MEAPRGLDEGQRAAWDRDAAFLAALQEPSAAAAVPLPAALRDVQMRPYQREGLAWLAFLRRSGLHGVLADDMGLGKTLQATAIVAGAPLAALHGSASHRTARGCVRLRSTRAGPARRCRPLPPGQVR